MKMQVQKTSFGNRKSWRKKTNQRPISYNWFNQYICGLSQNDRRPQSSQALGNKLNEAKTNLRQAGIIIERLENKANHSKDVILIKQDVGGLGTGNYH